MTIMNHWEKINKDRIKILFVMLLAGSIISMVNYDGNIRSFIKPAFAAKDIFTASDRPSVPGDVLVLLASKIPTEETQIEQEASTDKDVPIGNGRWHLLHSHVLSTERMLA